MQLGAPTFVAGVAVVLPVRSGVVDSTWVRRGPTLAPVHPLDRQVLT